MGVLSHWIRPDPQGPDQVHLREFAGEGSPALLVHGAIENGRVFYSRSGKGLAPFLANAGFNPFVLDLRGRGESRPKIGPHATHGQWESIVVDLPAVSDFLWNAQPRRQHWVAHSWGGVLMAAALARKPELRARVASLTFLGSKRAIRVSGLRKWFIVDLGWFFLSRTLVELYDYLPARRWRFGSDDESRLSHSEGAVWVEPGPWIDPRDGFDYRAALEGVALPPLLSLAGKNDRVLGHPSDVEDFLRECGTGPRQSIVLGRAAGNRRDYGHVDMLTAPEAPDDHFPRIAEWMRRAEEV